MSLGLHQLRTFKTQLHASKSMDSVINTKMSRLPAPQHLTVGSINNAVNFQAGNVALPQTNPGIKRADGGVVETRNTTFRKQTRQQLILLFQPKRRDRRRLTGVNQGAEMLPQLIKALHLRESKITLRTQLRHQLR